MSLISRSRLVITILTIGLIAGQSILYWIKEKHEADAAYWKSVRKRIKEGGYSNTTCPYNPASLAWEPLLNKNINLTIEEIEKVHNNVRSGGWTPPCKPRHDLILIVPATRREEHLRVFLWHIHAFLQQQLIQYVIYVVTQVEPTNIFNKAMTMNAAFIEATKMYPYSCVIFHDVDLIPESNNWPYTCETPVAHLAAYVDRLHYSLPYKNAFGGVVAFQKDEFKKVNGYSNSFWGWGGEDDDLGGRVRKHSLDIVRPTRTQLSYTMLRHARDPSNKVNIGSYHVIRDPDDGLKTIKYTKLDLKLHRLYTQLLVSFESPKVNLTFESLEQSNHMLEKKEPK
ncbi:unnamed protein product [Owenia fusiformis]|uniref:Beta-1,4-galactosyltransferase n=1 Tax=Owenia fusiformis TaxID=6347 RepID=A0A8J1Y0S2_OWEFU|nr:unnamed protein product [Owenia fusiformis]